MQTEQKRYPCAKVFPNTPDSPIPNRERPVPANVMANFGGVAGGSEKFL